uniref:Uncharacterized protein n=1 Tax=Solanum lycopersicum TaxID=4081 RepID=A0A3Q7G2G0_SOLLC
GDIPTEEDDVHAVEEDVALAVDCFFFLPLTFEVSAHKEEAFPVLGYLTGGCEGCLVGGCEVCLTGDC